MMADVMSAKVSPSSARSWDSHTAYSSAVRGHMGDRAPLGAHLLALIEREDDVGVAGVDGEQHQKNTSAGGDGAHLAAFVQQQRAAGVDALEHAGAGFLRQTGADGRAHAFRPRQPRMRKVSNPPCIHRPYQWAKRAARTVSASSGDGTAMPSCASEVAGNSVPSGWPARLTPMPMASHRLFDFPAPPSSKMPASFLPSASTSLGHLTAMAASGAKCAAISAAASAAAKESWPVTACGASGRSNKVAARLPAAVCQARPRRPRPALWRFGHDPDRARLRRPRQAGAPPHWWNPVRREPAWNSLAATELKGAAPWRPHRRR